MEKIETMEQFWLSADEIERGFIFAILTDEIFWEKWPLKTDRKKLFREKEKKLLDIRIYNSKREVRIFRSDIGRKFQGRSLNDEKEVLNHQDYFDEEQFLDIDDIRSKELFAREGKVQATGGGRYPLPLPDFRNAKLRIRNYLGYYEKSGQAYVKDWRLMDLFQDSGKELESDALLSKKK